MSIGIFFIVLMSFAFSSAPTSSATKEERLEMDEVRTEMWEAAVLAVDSFQFLALLFIPCLKQR